eukprot:COSAG01_NODE_8594_length_2725_cov_1.947829_3_plen_96_part_01
MAAPYLSPAAAESTAEPPEGTAAAAAPPTQPRASAARPPTRVQVRGAGAVPLRETRAEQRAGGGIDLLIDNLVDHVHYRHLAAFVGQSHTVPFTAA